MKKIYVSASICIVLIVIAVLCLAMDSGEPEVYIYTDGGTATIIGMVGFDKETLVLPSYDSSGLPITSIKKEAFERGDFSKVKHVVLPDYVAELPVACFSNFASLEKVTVGNGLMSFNAAAFVNTPLQTIIIKDDNTRFEIFDNCLISRDGAEIILWWGDHIPDTVTTIGAYCFYGNEIKAIDIPASVDRIMNDAFYGCSELTEVYIPGNVNRIDDFAFACCASLRSVTVGDGVEAIGESAFDGCSSLVSISLPESVTDIGEYAFSGTSLADIPSLGGAVHIADEMFRGCDMMVSVNIPEGIQSVGSSVFGRCFALESVHFPSTLSFFESWDIFWFSPNIEKLTVAESNPNYYAENNCIIDRETMTLVVGANLTEVPYGTVIIGEGALAMRDKLTCVLLPDTVERIERNAFADSKQLNVLYIPSSVVEVESKIVGGNADNLHIYCEADSQPDGWDDNWNSADFPVIWGISRNEFNEINK